MIGQFGVGFYSAFMVASRVTVRSRAFGAQEAWQWESTGAEAIPSSCDKDRTWATEVILVVKENEGEEHYDEFLDDWRLAGIVKKYSDYIRYPIKMLREKSRAIEGTDKDEEGHYKAPEYETYTEDETLNSMVPIWKRDKKKVKDEEYAQFYKDKFGDYSDPARVIQSKTEAPPRLTRCCSSLRARPTTTIPRNMKRACSSIPAACSSWKNAPTCCRIISAS